MIQFECFNMVTLSDQDGDLSVQLFLFLVILLLDQSHCLKERSDVAQRGVIVE